MHVDFYHIYHVSYLSHFLQLIDFLVPIFADQM